MQHAHASGSLPPDSPLYAPGLKRRKRKGREACYWMAPPQAVKLGYTPTILTIPPDASEAETAALCRKHWADMQGWRSGVPSGPSRYSIEWLIDRYQKDSFSPFQRLRFNSQRNYSQECEQIKFDIGPRMIEPKGPTSRISGEDVWRWHRMWGRPDAEGKITAPSRARHLITMFRILIKYAVTIGVPGAADLATVLANMEFPTTPARTVAPTRDQVLAIVKNALDQGYRSIAIATLAQFEFTERRISIIGRWERNADGWQWRSGWTWGDIARDWVIRYAQTKVGVVVREYDLKDTPVLLELIQRTPEASRIGPVIVCETTGLPWKEKHYTDTWRKIATAAGIPPDICSMDMRAGAATEIDSIAEITDRQFQDAGGWKDPKTKNRYRRAPQRNAQNVVKLRQMAREAK